MHGRRLHGPGPGPGPPPPWRRRATRPRCPSAADGVSVAKRCARARRPPPLRLPPSAPGPLAGAAGVGPPSLRGFACRLRRHRRAVAVPAPACWLGLSAPALARPSAAASGPPPPRSGAACGRPRRGPPSLALGPSGRRRPAPGPLAGPLCSAPAPSGPRGGSGRWGPLARPLRFAPGFGLRGSGPRPLVGRGPWRARLVCARGPGAWGWGSAACGRRARGPPDFLGILASACGLALAVAGRGARSLSRCIERNIGAPLHHPGNHTRQYALTRRGSAAGRPGRKIGRFCWKFPETLCILPIAADGRSVVL